MSQIVLHKPLPKTVPLSIVLTDWSCRDRFCALETLNQQTVPRDLYELLWVEYFSRVPEAALELADKIVTIGEKADPQNLSRPIPKHKTYNVGLLFAAGRVICIPDSDAWFPQNFVECIIKEFFSTTTDAEPLAEVAFIHELRTQENYPGKIEDISQHSWDGLKTNYGACAAFPTRLAVALGGYDEHESLVDGVCGPYELPWRMVNFGLAERWLDPDKIVIYHFNHPGSNAGGPGIQDSLIAEAVRSGRLLPVVENEGIKYRRLSARCMEQTLRNVI